MTWGSNPEADPPDRTWLIFVATAAILVLIIAVHWH